MNIIKNQCCRMCGSENLRKVFDIGDQPLVNSLANTAAEALVQESFLLEIYRCGECSLIQIKDIVDAQHIYKDVDYLYFSSDMPGLSEYFHEYAKAIQEKYLNEGDFIVEIGCNDGVMLNHFREHFKILGVDPSTNVVIRAIRKGFPVIPLFFSSRIAGNIADEFGRASAIIANNCIAHLNGLDDLMDGVTRLLGNDGVFVIECNYWGGMVDNTNYSLIYHDHYSYFTLKNWQTFLEKYEMHPINVEITPAQGGTMRLTMARKCSKHEVSQSISAQLLIEDSKGYNTLECALEFANAVKKRSMEIYSMVDDLRNKGLVVAGYGAAAKGFTIMNCAKLTRDHIAYFVDDSPAKQGKYVPRIGVPVISREEAGNSLPDVFFILAPNYAEHIMKSEAEFSSRGGKFIVPKAELKLV